VAPATAQSVSGALCTAPSSADTPLARALMALSNSTYAPFLYDGILAYAHAIDALARRQRSAEPAAISGNGECRERRHHCNAPNSILACPYS
jgi:hypothetical protein